MSEGFGVISISIEHFSLVAININHCAYIEYFGVVTKSTGRFGIVPVSIEHFGLVAVTTEIGTQQLFALLTWRCPDGMFSVRPVFRQYVCTAMHYRVP